MILQAGVLAGCAVGAMVLLLPSLRAGAEVWGAGWSGVTGMAVTPGGAGSIIARSGAIVLCAGVVLGISVFIGRRLLRVAARRGIAPAAGVPLLVGYGGLSLIVFGVTAVGLCRREVILGLAAVGLAAAGPLATRALARWLRRAPSMIRADPLAWSGLGIAGVTALPRFLLPETFGDSLQYHLLFPQQLLLRHRFPEPPVHESWGYSLFAECPNVLSLACGIDEPVKVVMAVLGLAPVLGLMRRLLPSTGVAGVVILGLLAVVAPAHAWVIGTAKNDFAALGFFLGALLVLRAGSPPGGRARAVVGGFLLGCALASKPVLAPFAGCLVAWELPGSGRRRLSRLAWLAGGALAPLAPWICRDLIGSLVPFYGFGTLGGSDPLGWRPAGPVAALRDAGVIWVRDAPLAVALLPWWILRRRIASGGLAGLAVGATLLMTAGWPGGRTHLDRYAYAGSVLLNLVALADAVTWWRTVPAFRGGGLIARAVRVAALACGVVLVARAQPWTRWHDPGRTGRIIAHLGGSTGREAYRRSMLGSYGEILPAIDRELAGAVSGRMLVVGGNWFWDIPVPLVFSCEPEPFIRSAVADARTPERIGVRFRQLGIRWVLYDSDYGGWERATWLTRPWSSARLARYAAFLRAATERVAVAPCRTPGWGIHWLLRVDRRPTRPRPVDVMPGADEAYGDALRFRDAGKLATARAEFDRILRAIPDVAMAKSLYGHFLVMHADPARGLPLIRDAAARGYAGCLEPADIIQAIAEHNLGRHEAALDSYERALAVHTLWPTTPLPALDPRLAERRHRRAVAAADRGSPP